MSFKILLNNSRVLNWDLSTVQTKLTQLKDVQKNAAWICSDLTIVKSNSFERWIWTIVAKYFTFLRKFVFHVDLEQSKNILSQLKIEIQDSQDRKLIKLFDKALSNFNAIAPKYSGKLITTRKTTTVDEEINLSSTLKKPQKARKPETPHLLEQEHVTSFPNQNGSSILNEQLIKAFDEEDSSLAAWYVKQGGSPSIIREVKTPKQKELLEWLKCIDKRVDPTPENLDHFAIAMGGGYKFANLKILETIAQNISKELNNSVAAVPSFMSISDFEIRDYMQKGIPEVFALWDSFIKTFETAENDLPLKETIRNKINITEKGQKILKEINCKITGYFKQHPYSNIIIEEWLKENSPQFIIARSTGKEDTEEHSNAGGNESIPFVLPEKKEISIAIGKVLASYFSVKSISQRLLSGDITLFKEKNFFVPVLIQVMITENVAGKDSQFADIPRSGVMFTKQNDKAEGVSFFQAGLGSNQGIVTSKVVADSYFVKGNNVHAVIRKKESRFVCVQDSNGAYVSRAIKNSDLDLQYNSALPLTIIHDMKKVADNISFTYGRPQNEYKQMDVEYTVKLKEKEYEHSVIYLLQARPLFDSSSSCEVGPTYVDLKELQKVAGKDKTSAEVILDGNAYVRSIEDSSEIIIEETLAKGFKKYLNAKNSSKIKVIITKNPALATSHEAVLLLSKGIAVMLVRNLELYKELKKNSQTVSQKKPLLVDTQRGIIVKATDADAKNMIKMGMISYPIPLELTIPPSQLFKVYQNHPAIAKDLVANFDKETEELIHQLQTGALFMNDIPNNHSQIGVREKFDLMAYGDTITAKWALGSILRTMKNRLVKSMKETEAFRGSINQPLFRILEAAVTLTKRELMPALEKYPPKSLDRLYPIKFLDAMIFQKPSQGVLDGTSFIQILSRDNAQKKEIVTAHKVGMQLEGADAITILSFLGISHRAFSEECREHWITFIKELNLLKAEEKQKAIKDLRKIINELESIDLVPIWVNCIFNGEWKSNSSVGPKRAKEMIQTLKEIEKEERITFRWISSNLSKLNEIEQQIGQWTKPHFVKKNTAAVIDEFMKNLGFNPNESWKSLKTQYNKSADFGKLALNQYMHRTVNSYDRIIKTMKSSQEFNSDQEQALAMGGLLQGYLEMMKSIFQLISSNSEQKSIMTPGMGEAVLFPEYIKKLEHGTKYEFGYEEVHGSIGFSNLLHYLKTGQRKQSFKFQAIGGINPLGEQTGKENFESMFPTQEVNFKKQFSKQFSARNEFAVNTLIIGSKADLNFTVHWPNTLEEYFTIFHQNMEQMIKYLNTKYGMNTQLLSVQAKTACDLLARRFEQEDISFIEYNEGKIHIGYQIPLQQHSASVIVSYETNNLQKGIEIEVQAFGNDEHSRWDQAAAIGAILAYSKGAGFTEKLSPEIDYEDPKGVKFSLHIEPSIDPDTLNKIVNTLVYIFKELTMESVDGPRELLDFVQNGIEMSKFDNKNYPGIGEIQWDTIPEECFQHTLWLNNYLMDKMMTNLEYPTASKIAFNSILGIARTNIVDYDRCKEESLKKQSIDTLKTLVTSDKNAYHFLVNKLMEDPDVAAHMPGIFEEITLVITSTNLNNIKSNCALLEINGY
jgi:hypothetical protein